VLQSLLQTARELGVPLEVRPDRHFLITLDEFRQHAAMHASNCAWSFSTARCASAWAF
jgi:hypothetical protein